MRNFFGILFLALCLCACDGDDETDACTDADGDGVCAEPDDFSRPDCDDADPDNFHNCSSCLDRDGDGWYWGCDDYTTHLGPDCDDYDPALTNNCVCTVCEGPSCGCLALWEPVCVWNGERFCFAVNFCFAHLLCEIPYCNLPLDEYGTPIPTSRCAVTHPGCDTRCPY